VAETVVFGEMSTGASNDLERASALDQRMVTEYGMSERLGVVTLVSNADGAFGRDGYEWRGYSEQTAQAIDEEVRRLLDEAYAQARHVLTEHRVVLDRLADALLRWETLQGEDLERAFTGQAPRATEPAEPASDRPARRIRTSLRPLRGAAMTDATRGGRDGITAP